MSDRSFPDAQENSMSSHRNRGFSLLEMLAAIAISLTLAGITTMAFVPVMKSQSATTAYNTTLTTLRRARDQAAADMRTYVVQFTVPGTITVTQSLSQTTTCQVPPAGAVLLTATLPTDITFHVEPGVPTSNVTAPVTPDQFGTALYPFDLDQNNPGTSYICFNPDGTATDQVGNIANGVVYLGRPGDLYSSRAITLWGSTGRIRGWRLYKVGAANTWSQQ